MALTRKEIARRYYIKHRMQEIAGTEKWRDEHREEYLAYQRAYDQRPERRASRKTPEARAKAAAKMRAWRIANVEKVEAMRRARYRKLRLAVLEAYGNKCVCCGETQPEFLAIDHINGGGKEDRAKYSHLDGKSWYAYLLKEHPDRVQILCHNCNCAKGHYGECPHETMRRAEAA